MAQWYECLQDYNFKILHISGSTNMSTDALSRLTEEERVHEEKLFPLIPPGAFINLLDGEDPNHLIQRIIEAQRTHRQWMANQGYHQDGSNWRDHRGKILIPPDDDVKRQILHHYHSSLTIHPGWDETICKVVKVYTWPRL
jgi:hypothetical protein